MYALSVSDIPECPSTRTLREFTEKYLERVLNKKIARTRRVQDNPKRRRSSSSFALALRFRGAFSRMHRRHIKGIEAAVILDEHLIFPLRADAIPLAKFRNWRRAAKRDPNCSLTPAVLFIRLVWLEGEGAIGTICVCRAWVMRVACATMVEGLPYSGQLCAGINIISTRFSTKSIGEAVTLPIEEPQFVEIPL